MEVDNSEEDPSGASEVTAIQNIKTLYIPDLPDELLDSKLLHEHFSQFGEVVRVNVSKKRKNTLIHFLDHVTARKAKRNGGEIKGFKLHIFWSASKKMDSSSQNKNPRPALNRNPADASEKPPDPSTRHRSALLRNLPSEKQTEEYEKSIPVNVRRQKTFKKARKHRSALLKHLPEEEGEEERTMKKHVPVASTSLPELQGIEDSDSGVVNPNPFVCSSEPALLGRGDTDSGLVNLFAVPSKTESVNPFTTVKTTTAQTVHTPFTSTLTATTSTANPFFVLNSPASSSHPGNPFLKSTFEIPLTDASQRQISPFFTSVMTAPTSSHSQRPFGSFPGSTLTVPAFSQARPVTPFFTSGLTAFTTSPATTVNPFTTNTFTATATTSPTMTVNPFTKSAITPVCTSTSVRLSSPFATNAFAVTNTSSSAKTVGPFVMSAFTSTATANPVQAVSHFTSNTFAATGTGSPSPDKPLTTPTPSSGASSSFKFTTHDAHNPLIPHIPPTTSSGFSSCFKFTTRDASTKHRSILLKRAAACSSESSPESSPRPTYGHSSGNHPIRSRVPDKKSKNVSSDSSPESNKKKVVTPHRPSRSTHISRSTHVPKELTSFDKALKLQKRSKELREMREQRESRGSRELRGSKDLRKGREVLKISLSSSKISDVPDEVRDELEALAEIPEYEKCQSVLNDEVFKIPSPKKFIVRSKIRTPVKKSQLIEQAASPAAEEKRKRRRSAVDEAVWKALMDMWDSKVNKAFETAEERYQILELRDKILRARRGKQSNVSQDVVAGTCPDMCPEKERYQRESRQQIALYEYRQGSYQEALCMDHSLAVKQYSRSSADQEEPLPHELRPAKELRMTMDYLLAKIVNRIDNKKENIAEWYQFLWDRTRGIRKDITQQDLCDMDAVCMLEECVRFHVYCSERLVSEGPNVFDHKINSENLTKCLQTLKYLYKDMYLKNVNCPNEPEFRAYIILLNLNDGNFMWELKKLRLEIINSEPVQFAIAIYHALSTNNYVRFFKLVKQTTFLNACILLRYFYQVRHKAMRIIVKSHSTGLTKKAVIPLGELERILCFESLREAAVFCDHLGLTITDVNPNTLVFREHMSYTPRRLSDSRAIKLIESKQKMSVGQTIRGGLPLETSSFEKHIVTSSFNLDGTLKKEVITQIKEHVEYQECSSKLDEMDTTENMEQESIDLGIRIERDIERLHEAKDEPKPEPMVAPVIPEIENVAPTPHEQQKSEDEKSVDSFEEMFGEISEEEVDVFLERLQNVALLEYDEMLLDVSCSMVRDTFRQVLAEEKEKIHKQEEEKRKKEELVQQRKIEEEQLKKLEMERQKQVEKERKEAEEHQRRLAEQKRMEEAKRKQEEKLQQAEALTDSVTEDVVKEMAEEVTTEEIELHNSCLETMDMVVDETVHEYSYSVVEEVCLESKVQYVMQKRQEGITRKYFNLWRDIVQKRQSRRRALEFPAWFTPLTSPEGFTGLPEVEPIWKKDRLEKVEIPPDLNHYAKMIPLWDLLALELFLNSPFKRICYKNYKLMFSIPDVNECPRWAPVLDLYMDVAFPKTEEGPMENGPAIFIRQILNANDGALRVLTVSAWRIHGSHLQDAEKKSRGMDALLFVYGNDADPAVSLKRLENFIGSMENYRGVSLAIVVTRNMDEKELEKILHLDELKERIQKPINVKFFFRESTYTGLHIAMASAVTWLSKTHESIERHPPYFTSPVLLMRTSLMNSLWDKFLSVESVPFEDNRMKLNLSQVVSIYNKACDELLDMVLDKDINETGFGAPEFEQFVKTPVVGFITYFVVPERYKTDEFKDMVTKIFTRAKFIAPSNEVIRNRVDLFNFVQTVCQQNELDQAVHMKICMYICQQTVKNQHPLLVDWCWAVKHSFSWIEVFKIMVQEKMTRLFSEIDPKLTVGLKAERIRDFEERQYRSFRLDYLCNEAEKSQEVVDPPVPELPTNVKRNLLYEPLPEVKRFKPDIETPYPSEESKHETSAEEEKALIEKNRKAMESLEATSAECEASMKAAIEQLQTIYEQEGLDYPDGTPSASAGTHPMTPYEEIRYYMGLPPPVFPNIVVPPVIPRIRTESEEPKMKPKTYLMQFGTSYRNVDINLTFEERLQCRNYTDMYLRNIEKGIELADNSIAEVLEDNEQLRSPSLSNTGEAVENVLTTRISHTQGAMQQQQRTCISQIEKTVEGLPSKSLSHTRETVEHPGTFHTRESVTKSLFLTRESVEECSSIFSSDSKKQVKQFPSSYASLTSEAMEWIPTESISHTREAVEESPSSDISYIGETLKGLRSRSMSSPKHDLESEGTYRSCTSGSSESTYVSCTSESTKRLSTKVISDTKKSLGEHTSTYIPSSIEAMEQLPTKVSCYEDITSSSEDEFFEPCNDF